MYTVNVLIALSRWNDRCKISKKEKDEEGEEKKVESDVLVFLPLWWVTGSQYWVTRLNSGRGLRVIATNHCQNGCHGPGQGCAVVVSHYAPGLINRWDCGLMLTPWVPGHHWWYGIWIGFWSQVTVWSEGGIFFFPFGEMGRWRQWGCFLPPNADTWRHCMQSLPWQSCKWVKWAYTLTRTHSHTQTRSLDDALCT